MRKPREREQLLQASPVFHDFMAAEMRNQKLQSVAPSRKASLPSIPSDFLDLFGVGYFTNIHPDDDLRFQLQSFSRQESTQREKEMAAILEENVQRTAPQENRFLSSQRTF